MASELLKLWIDRSIDWLTYFWPATENWPHVCLTVQMSMILLSCVGFFSLCTTSERNGIVLKPHILFPGFLCAGPSATWDRKDSVGWFTGFMREGRSIRVQKLSGFKNIWILVDAFTLVSLRNKTAERRGRQNACACQTWQGYYLRVSSWSSPNINVFWSLQKYLFKGKWSLAKRYLKQILCHACLLSSPVLLLKFTIICCGSVVFGSTHAQRTQRFKPV